MNITLYLFQLLNTDLLSQEPKIKDLEAEMHKLGNKYTYTPETVSLAKDFTSLSKKHAAMQQKAQKVESNGHICFVYNSIERITVHHPTLKYFQTIN